MDEFQPDPDEIPNRLDKVISNRLDISRASACDWIDSGLILVNGKPEKKSYRLQSGDTVQMAEKPIAPKTPGSATIPVEIVLECDDYLVINKQKGLVVHPGAGQHDETLVNALVGFYPQIVDVGQPDRPGIVHRLDKDTTGLMIVALTQEGYDYFVEAIRSREVHRHYLAWVQGHMDSETGLIDGPIGRSDKDPTKMVVHIAGKDARTRFTVIQETENPDRSLLDVELESGRTHQIRVHLSAIGHPVVGDAKYGATDLRSSTPHLHSARLEFVDPKGVARKLEVSPPPSFNS